MCMSMGWCKEGGPTWDYKQCVTLNREVNRRAKTGPGGLAEVDAFALTPVPLVGELYANFSALFLLLALPVLLLIMLGIKLTSKGPVFFMQERMGFNGRTFRMYKFRTMVENNDTVKETLRMEARSLFSTWASR